MVYNIPNDIRRPFLLRIPYAEKLILATMATSGMTLVARNRNTLELAGFSMAFERKSEFKRHFTG